MRAQSRLGLLSVQLGVKRLSEVEVPEGVNRGRALERQDLYVSLLALSMRPTSVVGSLSAHRSSTPAAEPSTNRLSIAAVAAVFELTRLSHASLGCRSTLWTKGCEWSNE